ARGILCRHVTWIAAADCRGVAQSRNTARHSHGEEHRDWAGYGCLGGGGGPASDPNRWICRAADPGSNGWPRDHWSADHRMAARDRREPIGVRSDRARGGGATTGDARCVGWYGRDQQACAVVALEIVRLFRWLSLRDLRGHQWLVAVPAAMAGCVRNAIESR